MIGSKQSSNAMGNSVPDFVPALDIAHKKSGTRVEAYLLYGNFALPPIAIRI
jgi:hypothetical protein